MQWGDVVLKAVFGQWLARHQSVAVISVAGENIS
jgi:hypothetical protein